MTEKFSGSGYASISESRMAVTFVAHYLSIGLSITVNVEPSPMPQISRSSAVGISFRCLPSSVPSGAYIRTVQ